MIAEKRGGCKTAIWKRVHGIDETRGHRFSLRNALPERKKLYHRVDTSGIRQELFYAVSRTEDPWEPELHFHPDSEI